MIRFQLISDTHGRFNKITWDKDADIVLCAGDVSENVENGFNFLKTSPNPVIFIPGNHEFYKGNYLDRIDFFKNECAKTNGHIHFADNETLYIDDVRIISSTLWSDFDNFDPLLVLAAETRMNDYSFIKIDNIFDGLLSYDEYVKINTEYKEKLTEILKGNNVYQKNLILNFFSQIHKKYNLPYKTVKEMLENINSFKYENYFSPTISYMLNKKSKNFLENELNKPFNGKTLIMTHHAPSKTALSMSRHIIDVNSISLMPILKKIMAPNKIGAYSNSLENLASKYNIDCWVHGHLHDRMFYRLGSASVHCNATGIIKNQEERTGFSEYSFYLNEETKINALINLLNHTIYISEKINEFLDFIVKERKTNLIEDARNLKALYDETHILINTLKSIPDYEIEENLDDFVSYEEMLNKFNLEKDNIILIINTINVINQEIKQRLTNWLNIIKSNT